ncbi:hypothetical protein EDB85DRAFT_1894907 [Lactarius pseudohatsudake]|nr:hypothetical protein EDB85DRAFT_1894907 [Lactarius pseudohatsudake]
MWDSLDNMLCRAIGHSPANRTGGRGDVITPRKRLGTQFNRTSMCLSFTLGIMRPSLRRVCNVTDAPTGVLATSSLHSSKVIVPVLGASDWIREGDTVTYLVEDVLPPELADVAFENLRKECSEVQRLVAVKGEVDANVKIRAHVERALQRPVNHVLIQLYRTGTDYTGLSEHSDKTTDVVRGSHIMCLSLGAPRTMTLKTKGLPARQGPTAYAHKRPDGTKDPAEYASAPPIGMFLLAARRIYGQGVKGACGGVAARSVWRRELPEQV